MKKSKQQRRREARARRIAKQLEKKSKNVVLPVPAVTPTNEASQKEETDNHAKEKAVQSQQESARPRKANNMSGFLSVAFLAIAAIFFSIAGIYFAKGGHSGLKQALYWGIGAFFSLGVGLAATYWHYIIKPINDAAYTASVQPVPIPTNRAWLTLVDAVSGGPLVFRGNNLNFSVKLIIKNRGDAVANGVTVNVVVVNPKWGDVVFKEPVERQKKLCESTANDLITSGIPIFPDETKTLSLNIGFNTQGMEANRIEDTNKVVLVLAGCVDYFIGDEKIRRQTGFIYDIQVFDPKDPAHPSTIRIGEDVPADRLLFTKYFFGGDYAN